MALNTVVIVGRLTKDIEIKKANEKAVANFTVAVDKPYNKNNDHPEANWIDCVAWEKTAEFLGKYFNKGSKVGITGSLQTQTYENKDKVKIKKTEVLVNTVDFVESKNSSQTEQQETAQPAKATEPVPEANADDLPF